MRLEDMTSPEFGALDLAAVVAVLPFAAVEQHGAHLPIATDSIIARALGERLEKRQPARVLLGPVQKVGSSPHHMAFPGSMTLGSRTFLDVAGDVTGSLVHHGVRRAMLLNAHGGNQALLDVAVQEIRLEHPTLRLVHATYWTLAAEAFAALRESAEGGMGHAGEMETSVMLHLRPDLVRLDRASAGGRPPRSEFDHRDMLRPGRVGQFPSWKDWTPNGVLGDPTVASSERGEAFLEAAVDALERLVADLLADRIG